MSNDTTAPHSEDERVEKVRTSTFRDALEEHRARLFEPGTEQPYRFGDGGITHIGIDLTNAQAREILSEAPPSLTNPNPKREDEREASANEVIGYLNVYRDDDGDLATGSSDLCATAEEASDFRASEFEDYVGVFALVPAASARPSPGDPVRAALEGNAFTGWSTSDLAGQCRMQARENLDPELTAFMFAVADRLAALSVSTPTGEGEADQSFAASLRAVLEDEGVSSALRGDYLRDSTEADELPWPENRRESVGKVISFERYAQLEAFEAAALAHPQQGGERALADIAAERRRQVEGEGWTPEHDDTHSRGEMADAAACYASYSNAGDNVWVRPPLWPWDRSWWRPGDRRRMLVKSGALIVAEIERLDRATAPTSPSKSSGEEA